MNQPGNHLRSETLRERGTQAFRDGDFAAARAFFAQAHTQFVRALGEDHPHALGSLSDFGAACSALGDHDAARAAHEAVLAARRRGLGDAHPEVGASLHNLGAVLLAQGDPEGAAACHRKTLEIWEAALGPGEAVLAKPLGALSVCARALGDAGAALDYARRALAIRIKTLPDGDPSIGAALDEYATALSGVGEDAAAIDAWQAALDIFSARRVPEHRVAPLLNNLGVASRTLGDFSGARAWFLRAVAADPDLAQARHNLAAILARLGETAEAGRQRDAALRRQSVFVQRAAPRKADVLILSLSDKGNVPLEHLLPERDFTRIWWFIAHAREPLGADLPRYDVVFNGIGDPDMACPADVNVSAFLAQAGGRRVLNAPAKIAATRRDILPKTLAGIEGLVVPPTCRLEQASTREMVMGAAEHAGIALPFLLRPAGAHGGQGVVLVENWEEFDTACLAGAPVWYMTSFFNYRSPDGFFRKYRMAFVDRRPHAYHLAISQHWKVHYFSADMAAHDWKLAEEAVFLSDPHAVLGDVAFRALEQAALRLDLDFCGIDFGLSADGRILVFEANATMLIHPENEGGYLAFKNDAVQRITNAVQIFVAASV